MIVHTLYPVSLDNSSDVPARIELELNGRLVEVEQVSPWQVRVVRLHSTDPNDYLHPRWQPGQLITVERYASNPAEETETRPV